ncbi:MAG: hypothetical protein LBG42_03965 [Treponema sp.]|jgi:hypothetical protein|nr:hypothetical protein [Treponema sp.]
MKVSTVMNVMPRYTGHHWLEDLRVLAEQCYQSHTIPFAGELPLPENSNITRNIPGGGINTQKLELQAACLGMERLAWIFGADAEYIGLTLKNNEPETEYLVSGQGSFYPVLLLANIKGRKPEPLDAQYAYFIDQFTETSITRCATAFNQELTDGKENSGESVLKRRSFIARHILYSLQEYDSGLSSKDMQGQNMKHIRENSEPGTSGFIKARSAYQSRTKHLSPAGKTIFNRIRTYLEKQKTAGKYFSGDNSGSPEAVYSAFQSLWENPSSLSKIWFDAHAFTRSLTASQFGPEPLSAIKAGIQHRKEADHDR